MSNYKWHIEEVFDDIKTIKNMCNRSFSDNQKNNALEDLYGIKDMLNNINDFDKAKRASHVYTIVENTIKRIDINPLSSNDNEANHLQYLKSIIRISAGFTNTIEKAKIKKIKRTYRTNEAEAIYIIKKMLNDFDSNLQITFDKFLEQKHLTISDKDSSDNTYVKPLKTLNKAYSSVKRCDNLSCIDDILYCFIKTSMFEANPNRNLSVYNKVLEIFFTLLATDTLKEQGYNDYHNLRLNILNHFKNWLSEFNYVTTYGSELKYDFEKEKYTIHHSSSLFDNELAEAYNRGQSFKSIIKPFIMVHSSLLAFSLYEQYHNDKNYTKLIINKLFNGIGVFTDEEIFNLISYDDCYDHLLNECKTDYKVLKKQRRFQKK